MKVHGACHCGSIRYEADVDPSRVTICHCTDCQKLTGSAFRVSVPTSRDDFVLLAGSPTTYIKTAESGAKRAQVFCQKCGSPVYVYAVDNPTTFGLRIGCIDERQHLPPRKQIWCQSALAWSMNIGDLPQRDRE